jgi:single stranded DNA-binding protein
MLQAIIIGNLGRNAILREGARGKYVTFSVADTRKYKDFKGQPVEVTQWVSCTINNDGGALLPYLLKGQKVFVSGPLTVRQYQAADGTMQFGLNVTVREIELCGASQIRPEQAAQTAGDFAVNSNAGAPPIVQQNNAAAQDDPFQAAPSDNQNPPF